jgi:hypothetical protein
VTLRTVGQNDADTNKKINVTPYSLQVIKAGATALSRRWAVIVAAAGGLPALGTILLSWTNILGRQDNAPLVRAAFLVSGSVLLSTVVLAIAIIVKSDVAARAMGTAAQRQAEADIAVASLTSYQYALTTPSYLVKKRDGTLLKVDAFKVEGGQLRVSSDGANIPNRDIEYLIDPRNMNPSFKP